MRWKEPSTGRLMAGGKVASSYLMYWDSVFVFVFGTRDGTRAIGLVRQVAEPLSQIPGPVYWDWTRLLHLLSCVQGTLVRGSSLLAPFALPIMGPIITVPTSECWRRVTTRST